MNKTEQQPRESLLKLVQYVFSHRGGLIQAVTYERLAAWIGRVTKHGVGHAHGMGSVLGRMGHLLQGIEGGWGEPIPHLQSLVVQKTGRFKGLPDEGIREFWPDYPDMTYAEKMNRIRIEHERIVSFGSRWNDVLAQVGLPPVTTRDAITAVRPVFGSGGESLQHKNFKDYVRQHPEIVGAESHWEAFVEYPLPSGDQIDVVFKSPTACIAVEVKASVSDGYAFDYERGLYQTIKYQAVLKAMATTGGYFMPSAIESVLVVESLLPPEYARLAEKLGIKFFEAVKSKVVD
jgi:hypothetical protein